MNRQVGRYIMIDRYHVDEHQAGMWAGIPQWYGRYMSAIPGVGAVDEEEGGHVGMSVVARQEQRAPTCTSSEAKAGIQNPHICMSLNLSRNCGCYILNGNADLPRRSTALMVARCCRRRRTASRWP